MSKGFTLVEMMVVVTIIAVMSSLAYPSFLEYSRKGPRSQAATLLTTASQKQQQSIMINRKYASSWSELYPSGANFGSLDQYYQYPPTVITDNGWDGTSWYGSPQFEIQLYPLAGRLMDADGVLCVRHNSQLVKFCGTVDEQVWYEK